jgi:hypothetical protein
MEQAEDQALLRRRRRCEVCQAETTHEGPAGKLVCVMCRTRDEYGDPVPKRGTHPAVMVLAVIMALGTAAAIVDACRSEAAKPSEPGY